MVSIEVKSRSKSIKDLSTDDLTVESKVSELIQLVSMSNNGKSQYRIRLNKVEGDKKIALDADKTFVENGFPKTASSINLQVKDLGPQIAWRTVYIVEYLGPLILVPLVYLLSINCGLKPTQSQRFAVVLSTLHYLKREYETVFVHKFSSATMPATFIIRNSAHYWILSGLLISLFSLAPPFVVQAASKYPLGSYIFHANDLPCTVNWALAGLWAFFELSNYKAHANLANLRAKDSKKYAIPYGYGFNLVSCPNYLFEILGWSVFTVLIGNWSSLVFTIVGGATMTTWAIKRHKRYLKTFGDEYKKLRRNVIFPGIL
ncbi:uncharacterized protein CANTADRAFT_91338 [Suhomyces tanzawaensis NRRL Y-17324]|uniref:3-oxo-5-alpha-steroid 4-dehydrogenase C-terminal domain-containing protein n=1 Tax=Suhomyces tanzawaensis NRRL Y-17324 TaxID=984487 RepID=A0A1E4SED6_9ASCO|nr:uncharacterized protein CANTADRAFT_91338 [Suhomyces tanzawaensis NRRL Y-17324]ODV77884.1 hypothetical protein CANTADRAFT_91338 [Suhomyces tanzawaensis NRRL Y-17324]